MVYLLKIICLACAGKPEATEPAEKPKKRKRQPDRTMPPDSDTSITPEKKRRQKKSKSANKQKEGEKKGRGKPEKKKKKKEAKPPSSTSDSSDSEEDSSSDGGSASSSSDEDGSSDSGPSGSSKKRKATAKSSKSAGSAHWQLVNEMWNFEARPKLLQDRKRVEGMSIAEISQFKAHFDKEEERKGVGSAVFGKDRKLEPVKVKKGVDDGDRKLSRARFNLRMPICAPKKYWHKVPKKREVFRHLPLGHLGLEGQVSEATVVRMHDRRVPVTLDMLYKANAFKEIKQDGGTWIEPTEIRHLQEAILNYTVILWAIWPFDYAGLVVQRVLVEANWGRAAGEAERQRVALVRKYFDEVMRENSGRAVRGQPPLVYEEAKAKWMRGLEAVFPSIGVLGMSAAGAKPKPQQQQQQQHDGQVSGNSGRGRGRGGAGANRGRGGANPAASGLVRQGAVASGLPVCYRYNLPTGCQRKTVSATACEDLGKHYAHACNWLDKASNKFCLQLHPRHSNH